MKLFASHIKSYRRTRHSFCPRMLKAFALTFVMVGLAQAEATEFACFQPDLIDPGPSAAHHIESSGEYVLTEDCVVEGGIDGIAIMASDVQLNLDGHTISGPGCGPGGRGISVLGSNVHVTGGTVKGFQTGVGVSVRANGSSAGHNQLSDLTVTENCHGIELRSSNNNHVNFNNVFRNLHDGVVVHGGSTNNQVDFNVINENGSLGGRGILVLDSDSNVFAFNALSRNEGGGVVLTTGTSGGIGSHNNTIASNIVTETPLEGIVVQIGDNNTIYGNLSTRNERGIALEKRASGNFVLRNTALDNTRPDLPDLSDARALETPPCDKNKWRDNIFKTDNEGGKDKGPGAGCIQ